MKKERIFYMDFVRTIGTLIIIIFHFNISIGVRQLSSFSILKNDFANGNLAYIGVPIFFILSGVALMYSNSEDFSVVKFYKKRIRATYPMFWVGYIVVFLYYFMRYATIHPFTEPPRRWTFLLTILGLDGYTSSITINYYLIGEWFLGCIILMYLMFPILYWGVTKHPIWCWIPVITLYVLLTFNYVLPTPMTQDVFMRLPEFLFGMYIGKYYKKVDLKVFLVSCVGLIIILFIPLYMIPQMFIITFLGICSFMVLAYIGQNFKCERLKPVFLWFSKYSFAVYLLHHVISEQIISRFEGRLLSAAEVCTLFCLVLILDCAGGFYLHKGTTYILNTLKSNKLTV